VYANPSTDKETFDSQFERRFAQIDDLVVVDEPLLMKISLQYEKRKRQEKVSSELRSSESLTSSDGGHADTAHTDEEQLDEKNCSHNFAEDVNRISSTKRVSTSPSSSGCGDNPLAAGAVASSVTPVSRPTSERPYIYAGKHKNFTSEESVQTESDFSEKAIQVCLEPYEEMNPNQLLKSGSPTARRAGTPKQSIDLQANKSENWKIEQPEWFRPVENVPEIDHKPDMGFASGDMIIQNDEPAPEPGVKVEKKRAPIENSMSLAKPELNSGAATPFDSDSQASEYSEHPGSYLPMNAAAKTFIVDYWTSSLGKTPSIGSRKPDELSHTWKTGDHQSNWTLSARDLNYSGNAEETSYQPQHESSQAETPVRRNSQSVDREYIDKLYHVMTRPDTEPSLSESDSQEYSDEEEMPKRGRKQLGQLNVVADAENESLSKMAAGIWQLALGKETEQSSSSAQGELNVVIQ